MTLDTLNQLVTIAITVAKHLPTGSFDAKMQWFLVCRLEVAIAELTPPHSPEGLWARRWAVIAATKADNPNLPEVQPMEQQALQDLVSGL